MDHAESLQKLRSGDVNAFRELVEAWQDKVFNTAIGIVQDKQDAEDITQEVFVTLHEQIQSFKAESTIGTWLYRIALRKALDHEKKKRRQKHGGLLKRIFGSSAEMEAVDFHHPGIAFDNKERSAVLFGALNQLPENQRVAFILHKLEGLSYEEIAGVMGSSLFAVESLQVRAKKSLQNLLRDYYSNNKY